MFVLPMLLATFLSGAIVGMAGGFNDGGSSDKSKVEKKDNETNGMKVKVNGTEINIAGKKSDDSVKDSDDSDDEDSPKEKDPAKEKQKFRVKLATNIFTLLWLPIVVLVSSFVSVITALLYFKTRLAGGESMQDLLQKFEAADSEKTSKWQNRIRERLQQSGRITGKTQ
jgi:hypothetical protein